jgi:spore coat polysaccharide biosynthesis protein SpsF (cytidylyltransferase family)
MEKNTFIISTLNSNQYIFLSMTRLGFIIQARMRSTRLPGKVLMSLGDSDSDSPLSLLTRKIRYICLKNSGYDLVVATSNLSQDDPIYEFCQRMGILCYRGSEYDVLQRYADCAKHYAFDSIVRIPGDNPLLTLDILDSIVKLWHMSSGSYDYLSNTLVESFPSGFHVEIFKKECLFFSASQANSNEEREHVTPFIYNSQFFKCLSMQKMKDHSWLRLTVDYQEDFDFVSKIYSIIEDKTLHTYQEILQAAYVALEQGYAPSHIEKSQSLILPRSENRIFYCSLIEFK